MSPPDLSKMKGFDPRLFMSYADKVGHGAAVGIVYHDHGPDWVELALPYEEKLIGVAERRRASASPAASPMTAMPPIPSPMSRRPSCSRTEFPAIERNQGDSALRRSSALRNTS